MFKFLDKIEKEFLSEEELQELWEKDLEESYKIYEQSIAEEHYILQENFDE